MLDPGADALGLASGEGMQAAHLNYFLLEHVEDGLLESVESMSLQVVEQGDTELVLILRLYDAQVGTDGLALVRLQIVEQVNLG